MPHSTSASSKQARLDIPSGGLRFVTKDMLRRILRSLGRQMGIDIQIDGATRSSSSGSTLSFQVPAGSTAAADASVQHWRPSFVDATHITISPGSCTLIETGGTNEVSPTFDGDLITADPPPQLTVHATSLNYVYLKIAIDTITLSNDFVVSFVKDAVTIVAETTEQTSDDTVRYFELFRWQASALVAQTRRYNIGLRVRDDGSNTSTPVWLDWLASS